MMEKKTNDRVIEFRNQRDWKQYHNPKDLAISLSLEAAELLENFQWSTSEEAIEKRIAGIKEELADVLIYSILLAESLSLNLDEIILEKLNMNSNKYPIEKAFGRKEKYTETSYEKSSIK